MVAVAAAMCPQDSLADTAAHARALSTRPLATGRLTHGERLRASHTTRVRIKHGCRLQAGPEERLREHVTRAKPSSSPTQRTRCTASCSHSTGL